MGVRENRLKRMQFRVAKKQLKQEMLGKDNNTEQQSQQQMPVYKKESEIKEPKGIDFGDDESTSSVKITNNGQTQQSTLNKIEQSKQTAAEQAMQDYGKNAPSGIPSANKRADQLMQDYIENAKNVQPPYHRSGFAAQQEEQQERSKKIDNAKPINDIPGEKVKQPQLQWSKKVDSVKPMVNQPQLQWSKKVDSVKPMVKQPQLEFRRTSTVRPASTGGIKKQIDGFKNYVQSTKK